MDITIYALLKGLISKATTTVADKLDKNQGKNNSGKVMTVDAEGNLVPMPSPAGVAHQIVYNSATNCLELK